MVTACFGSAASGFPGLIFDGVECAIWVEVKQEVGQYEALPLCRHFSAF